MSLHGSAGLGEMNGCKGTVDFFGLPIAARFLGAQHNFQHVISLFSLDERLLTRLKALHQVV